MRTILFFLLLLSFSASGQINRSANELARETTKQYLCSKLFDEKGYVPVSFGQLQPFNDRNKVIEWTLEHRFEIVKNLSSFDSKAVPVKTNWYFIFYLDHEMKVIRARSYSG